MANILADLHILPIESNHDQGCFRIYQLYLGLCLKSLEGHPSMRKSGKMQTTRSICTYTGLD